MTLAQMQRSLKTLPRRIVVAAVALTKLLYFRPSYFFLAAGFSILFYQIIFWFLNIALLQYLLTTSFLSFGDKIGVIMGSYAGVFSAPYSPLALALFAVSVFQGISVAAIVYSIRQERAMNRSMIKDFGSTGAAGILSVLGLGCAACGTSLVTPILTFFFATSSAAVADEVGFYSAMLALVVSAVTLYLAGFKLSSRLRLD